ncbi:hypothetical protein HHL16_22455 [Pseudoflavitalea sp. G-6-1-2]|uniref:hypothetical protein n=1 Tax=Pseudoflavitalea sp. G-6-1-2 TaxID=2728841 RepID=UPI00146A4031|nr:hypothetical protein [Pseudoflavitalea sp. G-6-1-2]NML23659.1 hypothetical protein [Pseudoflavitalea sp. G-6-1-2]
MNKEKRQKLIKQMIDKGDITLFKEIFDFYDITPVILHLKTNHATLTSHINNPSRLRMGKIISIADYFGVDDFKMITIVYNQIQAERKSKRRK